MANIRVLLVDDHAILREGLKALLNLSDDIEVVADATGGEQAIEFVRRYQPDVVVMDMVMPGMGGIEATRRIVSRYPQTRVLILSQYDNERYILPVLQAGALGYVVKRAVGEELLTAIRRVYCGQPCLDPTIEKKVLKDYHQQVDPLSDPSEEEYGITERQKQVLKLVAQGYTSEEIGNMLHLSVKTVMRHRANIYARVGTNNLAELVRLAIRLGLVEL
jgi:DNA-binding NarL/FixJ family response regulator